MERFTLADEQPEGRLADFVKRVWEGLVPSSGECVSVQGELIRVPGRLLGELFRNGFSNYYDSDRPRTESHYGGWLEFALGVVLENQGDANTDADLGLLRDARAHLDADYARELRIRHLQGRFDDDLLTPEEDAEFTQLERGNALIAWEATLTRLERCAANWVLTHPLLVDRKGAPVKEGGVADVRHLFSPPPPPPKCPLCGGRGWTQADEKRFPERCACVR